MSLRALCYPLCVAFLSVLTSAPLNAADAKKAQPSAAPASPTATATATAKPAAAATAKPQATAAAKKSLFDRLGKKPAIKAVVNEFVANCAADKRVNSFFTGLAADATRLESFKGKLVDQICQASGGPCKYAGRNMKETHHGLGITEANFNAVVEDLTKALDKFKVPAPEKKELLALLGPMKKDIVEKK